MKLTFTKRDGKYDDLLIERPDLPADTIQCPKQGIIPHDMVHYAIESTLAKGGFLTMVADGSAAAFQTQGGEAEEAIERLVETFQAEMWGGRVPAADLIATYEHACESKDHWTLPVTAEDVEAIRATIDDLTAKWSDVPIHGSLTVEM